MMYFLHIDYITKRSLQSYQPNLALAYKKLSTGTAVKRLEHTLGFKRGRMIFGLLCSVVVDKRI